MGDVAAQVDEIDSAVSPDKGSKERKPWSGGLWVERAQPNAPAPGGVLLYGRNRCFLAALQRAIVACRGAARAENAEAGEEGAAGQAEGLMNSHGMALRDGDAPHLRLDASARASVACATGVSAESGKGDTLLTLISQRT